MAGKRRSRQDIEDQMAALQAELEAAGDDDDAEIWVKRGDTETRLTGTHKDGFLKNFLGEWLPGAEGDDEGDGAQGDGDEGTEGDGAQGDEGGAPRRSYWGGAGRRPA